jgi:hypothetical protein
MKTPLLALSLCATLLTGCVSTSPVVPLTTAQTISNIVEPVTASVVPLVLNKNPLYADALGLLADAIPTAFGDASLTPESIAGSLKLLNEKAKLNLSDEVQAVFATAISVSVTQYQERCGVTVSKATDPGVKLLLESFSRGLKDGVTTWKKANSL